MAALSVELFGFGWCSGGTRNGEFGWESKVFQYLFDDWRVSDDGNQLEAARAFWAAEYV